MLSYRRDCERQRFLYAVQVHSRSLISVLTESPYAASYYWITPTYIPSRTFSSYRALLVKLSPLIGMYLFHAHVLRSLHEYRHRFVELFFCRRLYRYNLLSGVRRILLWPCCWGPKGRKRERGQPAPSHQLGDLHVSYKLPQRVPGPGQSAGPGRQAVLPIFKCTR